MAEADLDRRAGPFLENTVREIAVGHAARATNQCVFQSSPGVESACDPLSRGIPLVDKTIGGEEIGADRAVGGRERGMGEEVICVIATEKTLLIKATVQRLNVRQELFEWVDLVESIGGSAQSLAAQNRHGKDYIVRSKRLDSSGRALE